jgi:Uncharacterized protein conserved in bacteria (DUF2188)
MPEKNRHVTPDPNGGWNVQKPGASRASSHHDTQKEATAQARQTVARTGGDTIVHGRDGQIRHRDTAKGGNDPNPPRDQH